MQPADLFLSKEFEFGHSVRMITRCVGSKQIPNPARSLWKIAQARQVPDVSGSHLYSSSKAWNRPCLARLYNIWLGWLAIFSLRNEQRAQPGEAVRHKLVQLRSPCRAIHLFSQNTHFSSCEWLRGARRIDARAMATHSVGKPLGVYKSMDWLFRCPSKNNEASQSNARLCDRALFIHTLLHTPFTPPR